MYVVPKAAVSLTVRGEAGVSAACLTALQSEESENESRFEARFVRTSAAAFLWGGAGWRGLPACQPL